MLSWGHLKVEYEYQGCMLKAEPISGRIRKGEIHIILSDRSTLASGLLYTLAYKRPTKGEIQWNGHERGKHWIKIIGIVPIQDNLARKLRVREHLLQAVSLRRWHCTNKKKREELVKETIEFFGFQEIANTRIKHAAPDYLSFYQRRLLVLANELIGGPEIIFLENPFGEMDSDKDIREYCFMLRRIAAERNVAIIISAILPKHLNYVDYESLTVLLEGRQVFFGDYDRLIRTFSEIVESPKEQAFDKLAQLLSTRAQSSYELENRLMIVESFPDISLSPSPSSSSSSSPSSSLQCMQNTPPKRPCSWIANFTLLTRMQFVEDVHSKKNIFSLIISSFIIYLLLSFIFFRLSLTTNGLYDRVGLFSFLSFNIVFVNTLSKLVKFKTESARVRHEKKLGLIYPSCLVLSQFIAALPIRFLLVASLGTALYYITGLRTDGFQHVVVFLADLLLLTMTSVAFGILMATLIVRLDYGQIVVPFVVVMFFLYGNLSTAPNATWILKWLQYLSPIYYSFQCLIQNELSGLGKVIGVDTSEYLSINQFDNMPIAACLPILFGFACIYLLGAYLVELGRTRRYDQELSS